MSCLNRPLFDTDLSRSEMCKHDPSIANVTILGDSQCGKTALVFRWLNGTYDEIEPGSYLEDIYSKSYLVELLADSAGQPVLVQKRRAATEVRFLDCEAPDKTYTSELTKLQLRQSDAFVLCFDPTDAVSFESVTWYYRKIESALGPDGKPLIFICSTKSDLEPEYEVGPEEVLDFLQKFEISQANFFQVSAKAGVNTTELVCHVLKEIKREKTSKAVVLAAASVASAAETPTKTATGISTDTATSSATPDTKTPDTKTPDTNTPTGLSSKTTSGSITPDISPTVSEKKKKYQRLTKKACVIC